MRPTKPKPEPKLERSLDALSPAFKRKVELVLAEMIEEGFDPLVWETKRSFERAEAMNAKKQGRAIKLSMHCFGLAVDIVHRTLRWEAPPAFWNALGRIAKKHGLIWGGDFTKIDPKDPKGIRRIPDPDRPHIQAVRISMQTRVRNTYATLGQQHVDAIAKQFLADTVA